MNAMQKKRLLIEALLVAIVSALLIPVGVYWLSDEPGIMLLMVYYPWNTIGFVLGPAAVAAIAAFVISRFIQNRKAFWTVFRPAFYICWGFVSIRFLVTMMMS